MLTDIVGTSVLDPELPSRSSKQADANGPTGKAIKIDASLAVTCLHVHSRGTSSSQNALRY